MSISALFPSHETRRTMYFRKSHVLVDLFFFSFCLSLHFTRESQLSGASGAKKDARHWKFVSNCTRVTEHIHIFCRHTFNGMRLKRSECPDISAVNILALRVSTFNVESVKTRFSSTRNRPLPFFEKRPDKEPAKESCGKDSFYSRKRFLRFVRTKKQPKTARHKRNGEEAGLKGSFRWSSARSGQKEKDRRRYGKKSARERTSERRNS